mmetsp:Transcript_20534/g.60576  ORF Transcript_20534/g.60576 Transcript_20534/m.60576 type:complete len:203 (-) Transcript_20534:353-961(-)
MARPLTSAPWKAAMAPVTAACALSISSCAAALGPSLQAPSGKAAPRGGAPEGGPPGWLCVCVRECDVEPMREEEVLQAGRRLGRQLHPLHGLVDEGERGLVVLHGEVGLEVGLQQPRRAAEGLGHRRGERVRVDVDAKGALLVPGGACGALPRRPSNLQPVHDGEWASLAGAVDQHRGEDRHYDAPFHLLPLAALALVVRVR